MPEEAGYLWNTYRRLSSRRGSNGFGINPIAWSEIEAFVRLTGTRLVPWEIEIIEFIDDLFLAEQAKTAPRPPDAGKGKTA